MRRQRGFSLIEVIVAFVLLATAMGILLAILGGGLAQVRQAGQASEATLYAQSLLADVGVLEPIRPGIRRGELENGRYRWTLEVSEVPDPLPPPEPAVGLEPVETVGLQRPGEPVLYLLQLDVAWGEGEAARSLRFSSLRARLPEAAGP
ncbi:type IV pilus modification PilV family protein [Arenimonas caeni]|jgi:general secretion pathway protein I|uniref:General secretion pathway protein GspI n=1 Tax=Arenimonas caeni TaxID=2058085 RepID=A0A2P6MC18_9GAMM|nr:prepilin-type N-terminal cleavage/methylation domain-containing protein [Arenimonas caeni]MDY0022081.1 prepilin-type N-terminal cleavage/methylation domain-containing protein [Arenimonas caeni]PRH83544.1 general secretion pathway protein GspI [Arenimonas caeni]